MKQTELAAGKYQLGLEQESDNPGLCLFMCDNSDADGDILGMHLDKQQAEHLRDFLLFTHPRNEREGRDAHNRLRARVGLKPHGS